MIYHLQGWIEIFDGPGVVWRGEEIAGRCRVELNGTMAGETAGRAFWQVAQIVSFGWRYVEAYDVRAVGADGRAERLRRNVA